MGYLSDALWDLWDGSIDVFIHTFYGYLTGTRAIFGNHMIALKPEEFE